MLVMLSLVIAFGTLVILPAFLDWFYEGEYADAAFYVRVLTPLFALMIAVFPVSSALYVLKKTRVELINQLLYFGAASVAFGIAVWISDLSSGVILFSILSSLRYVYVYLSIKKAVVGSSPELGVVGRDLRT